MSIQYYLLIKLNVKGHDEFMSRRWSNKPGSYSVNTHMSCSAKLNHGTAGSYRLM